MLTYAWENLKTPYAAVISTGPAISGNDATFSSAAAAGVSPTHGVDGMRGESAQALVVRVEGAGISVGSWLI